MTEQTQQQLVWDAPTRLFHWSLVGLLGFSWWTAEIGDMQWHQYSGLAICGLILFRILWGFIGTSTARFAQFLKGPGKVWSYVRLTTTDQPATPGHNPVGGWSVVILLLLVSAQVVSGLFAVDLDGIESGPLSYLLSFDQGRTAASIHETSFDLLLAVVVLHVAAVLFYLVFRRRNLIQTMVTGKQPVAAGSGDTETVVLVARWRLVVAALIATLLTYAVANGFSLQLISEFFAQH